MAAEFLKKSSSIFKIFAIIYTYLLLKTAYKMDKIIANFFFCTKAMHAWSKFIDSINH